MKNKINILFWFLGGICFLLIVKPIPGKSADKVVFEDSFETIGENGLPVGWESWKPYHLDLYFQSEDKIAFSGEKSYFISGNGNKHAKGSLRKQLTGLKTGKYYHFSVFYTTRGIESGINNKVIPVIKYGTGRNFSILVPTKMEKGWVRSEMVFQLPEKANGKVLIDLFAGWIPEGYVFWDNVTVVELENFSFPKKEIKAAVIDAVPTQEGSSLDNCNFYISQINNLCQKENPDVICLTETFNEISVKEQAPQGAAVSMDSEYMNRLKNAALNNNVNLVGSISEDENGILFNTGFLINRQGKLVEKYHKAQLAETEILFSNRSRGDELKVIQADFGKIGIIICYDYHFPEFARSLALMGAEILFVPIAGDGRLTEKNKKTGMEHVGKAITLENRIPVVFARRGGVPNNPSNIINNEAKVVAETSGSPYIVATLDLKNIAYQWTGANFKDAYFTFRRPELYPVLLNNSFRLKTDKGSVFIRNPDIEMKQDKR